MSRRRVLSVLVVNALLAASVPGRAAAIAALQPGGVTPFQETVDVNVVFVRPQGEISPHG